MADNEIIFGAEYQHLFREMALLEDEAKDIKKRQEEARETILRAMEKHNIKSFENDYLKVTYVSESESWSVDWKAFEFEEPEMYEDIARKFTKKRYRKAYVKVTVR